MTEPTPPTGPEAPPSWEELAGQLAPDRLPPEPSVADWLATHPADAALLERLDGALTAWGAASRAAAPVDAETALAAVRARRDADPARTLDLGGVGTRRAAARTIPRRWGAWAGLAAAAALGAVVLRPRVEPAPAATTAGAARPAAPTGRRDSVRLADGTRVILAPGSALDVPAGYGTATRTVALHGEGWFDVSHRDGAPPFMVAARHVTVRDIGTAFAIVADPVRPVRVVVTEGRVALRTAATAAETPLAQGDVATVPDSATVRVERQGATADDTAWLEDRLVFREASLAEVTVALRRWYGVRIEVADRTLDGRHVTASFQGEPRERVLELLALALGARVEQRGDTAILRGVRP